MGEGKCRTRRRRRRRKKHRRWRKTNEEAEDEVREIAKRREVRVHVVAHDAAMEGLRRKASR
jgi:hypothetical protein